MMASRTTFGVLPGDYSDGYFDDKFDSETETDGYRPGFRLVYDSDDGYRLGSLLAVAIADADASRTQFIAS